MASPSGPRATTRAVLEPHDILAGRYRLVRPVPDTDPATPAPTQLWQATDEVLARAVAVKVLAVTGRARPATAAPFLEAAGRAGSLSHPGLARVYDAALEERPAERAGRTVDLAFVVSEWVEGRTLSAQLLAEGPLSPVDAVALTQDAAEALGAAHGVGVGHGRIHLGNLMITPAGRLRITDAAVAAAAHGEPLPPVARGEQLGGPEIARDTRDLAAVLYAMLTARWPVDSTPQPASGLPAAPRSGTGTYAPRQVRAGVPRSLDTVVVRALEPARQPGRNPITTPRAMAQALDEAGPELRAAAPSPAPARSWRPPSRVLRLVPKVIVVAALVGIGLACYQVGKHVGELPRRPGALDALAEPSPSAAAAGPVTSRLDLSKAPVVVRDYDPFGRDGTEQPGSVPNAFDGDPTTAWSTDGYGSAAFGGLKPGVGLLVDLGRPTRIASVQVGLVTAGAGLELRSSDQLGDNADTFTTVAKQDNAKQVATLTPSTSAPARYWLVWFTSLPKGAGGRFRDGVAELVFNGPAS